MYRIRLAKKRIGGEKRYQLLFEKGVDEKLAVKALGEHLPGMRMFLDEKGSLWHIPVDRTAEELNRDAGLAGLATFSQYTGPMGLVLKFLITVLTVGGAYLFVQSQISPDGPDRASLEALAFLLPPLAGAVLYLIKSRHRRLIAIMFITFCWALLAGFVLLWGPAKLLAPAEPFVCPGGFTLGLSEDLRPMCYSGAEVFELVSDASSSFPHITAVLTVQFWLVFLLTFFLAAAVAKVFSNRMYRYLAAPVVIACYFFLFGLLFHPPGQVRSLAVPIEQALNRDQYASSLVDAAATGDLDAVKKYVDRGIDPADLDTGGRSAMVEALKARNTEVARFLNGLGVPYLHQNRNGQDILYAAFRADDLKLLEQARSLGIDLDMRGTRGQSLAMHMIEQRMCESYARPDEKLDRYGIAELKTFMDLVLYSDPNLQDDSGDTVIMYLLKSPCVEYDEMYADYVRQRRSRELIYRTVLKPLIDRALTREGTDFTLRNREGHSALTYAKYYTDYLGKLSLDKLMTGEVKPEVIASASSGLRLDAAGLRKAVTDNRVSDVRIILAAGVSPDSGRILHDSVSRGYTDVARLLLERGADPDLLNTTFSLMYKAVESGKADMVKLLLDKGISPDDKRYPPKDSFHQPLRLALTEHLDKIATLLIDGGADISRSSDYLNLAVESGSLKLMEKLVDRGLDVNVYSRRVYPIYIAVGQENIDMVRALVKRGAKVNVEVKSRLWRTPLQLAAANGNMELIRFLLDHGAQLDYIDGFFKRTALMAAAMKKQPAVVEFLISRGADTRLKDKHGMTALDHALVYKDKKVIKLLQDAKNTRAI